MNDTVKQRGFHSVIRTIRAEQELDLLKSLFNPTQAAEIVKECRGSMGMRECGKIIGISAATLSRIEKGFVVDMATMKLIYEWLIK